MPSLESWVVNITEEAATGVARQSKQPGRVAQPGGGALGALVPLPAHRHGTS